MFNSRPEATSDVISGIILGLVFPDNRVKFSDPDAGIAAFCDQTSRVLKK